MLGILPAAPFDADPFEPLKAEDPLDAPSDCADEALKLDCDSSPLEAWPESDDALDELSSPEESLDAFFFSTMLALLPDTLVEELYPATSSAKPIV